MLHSSLTLHLIIFSAVPVLFNLISLPLVLRKREAASLRSNPSIQPLLWLLVVDILLSLLFVAPIYNFVTEKGHFTSTNCIIYGSLDMILSLMEVFLACIIAFDRYIVTIAPKWGKWRCHGNYLKCIVGVLIVISAWSLVPILGYGRYSTFHDDVICSLDWRQGNIIPEMPETRQTAHRYIAFLTATCLVFFLIPVCVASSFYYSIIDHVERLNSAEVREDPAITQQTACPWAPRNHVAKIGLGGLLVSVVPFFAYSVVCLNPMKSDFHNLSYVVVPAILSRFSTLLNPLFYIWLNPEIVPIDEFITKRLTKARPPRPMYHTINLIADVPGMSFPILTPTVPRRQLPKIPPHLLSPSRRSPVDDPKETTPML
ncbi:unnamed protein product [Caenorhabditis auriculariae]|uniref:G-protein coupled receptors family 1 profile domain-containing protein n=1 Tax=Caenorhabditis auriculariae TaxID=2777116 RepID=A0A8S1HE00_9PELO|nr:unnamed protein product [Caenorhabditis auriculariae]